MLLLFGIVILIGSVHSYCPNNQICDCTFDYINCTCIHDEKLIFREIKERFSGKEFKINKCVEVTLKKLSLQHLNVQSLFLSNLLKLQIEPFVFHESQIRNLHISNITMFYLEPQGFNKILNITNLTISNVTIEQLRPAIITHTTVPNFSIKNSHITTVESNTLQLEDFKNVIIENNTIDIIKIGSIRMRSINKFSFIHNSVNITESNSFSISSANEVDFGFCQFLQLSSNTILTKDVDLFTFHDNYVEKCEKKTFWSTQATKSVHFIDNQILIAKADSLIPNRGPNQLNTVVVVNENNEIGCDCNIAWLLTVESQRYQSIKEKNVCYYPQHLKGLNLSLLTVSVDENNNCISVDTLTTTSLPFTNKTTVIETEGNSITGSGEEEIVKTISSSTEKPAKDRQAKQGSKENSGDICLCNTIFLFILLIIMIY